MAKKKYRATRREVEDFESYEAALEFSDDIEVINLDTSWTITVYKHAVDGFRKGAMIEPIKQSVEKLDDSIMSITEYPHTYVVTSFISELHAIAVARELVQ